MFVRQTLDRLRCLDTRAAIFTRCAYAQGRVKRLSPSRCSAQTVDLGQSMDCLAQSVDRPLSTVCARQSMDCTSSRREAQAAPSRGPSGCSRNSVSTLFVCEL